MFLTFVECSSPVGVASRLKNRFRERRYRTFGPNYAWHIDGYDKLKPHGFPIHGAVDGFSRMILWSRVVSKNNNPKPIGFYFLNAKQTEVVKILP